MQFDTLFQTNNTLFDTLFQTNRAAKVVIILELDKCFIDFLPSHGTRILREKKSEEKKSANAFAGQKKIVPLQVGINIYENFLSLWVKY